MEKLGHNKGKKRKEGNETKNERCKEIKLTNKSIRKEGTHRRLT